MGEAGGSASATTTRTRDDLVVAFVDIVSSMGKAPLENGDQVRFVRDGPYSFDFFHVVHGQVYSDYHNIISKKNLPRLIDQGHIVLPKEATVLIYSTTYNTSVHFWLEIGIRKECVEMVSRVLFRGSGHMRVYLRITPGNAEFELHYEKNFLGQVYEKWKTSRQFLMEFSKDAAGVGLSPPANVIKLELYEHQKQGLRWMIDREKWPDNDDTELPPFWEEKDGLYRACMSSFLTLKRPEMVRGGILADESGMGKTLTILSLIAYTKQHSPIRCGNMSKREAITCHVKKKRKVVDHDENGNFEWRPTLVVCPPSVLATWNTQIEKCTWPGSLEVCSYHGKSKTKDPNLLRQHDLVLTTYNIVVREEESGAGILNKIDWWRVVLDDVHVLRGLTSRVTTPFINLKAKRRWAVTGKPFQEVHENYHLHPSMAFLQVHPYCDKEDLELFQCSGSLTKRVEVLMGIFSLRRTMPPRFIQNHTVVLSKDEQDLYDSMEAEAKKAYSSRTSLHTAVLHLWQSCNSPALCRLSCAETKKIKNFQDVSCKPELFKMWVNVLEDNMSSKVCALLTMLRKSKTTVGPNKKSVVFSQFRTMLMLVEGVLLEAGFDVRCMDTIDKAKTVKEFSNAESSRVVLLTTFKALSNTSGLGLDLSAASNVYLMEPCWNAHTEDEALSSIHRLGNKEDVNFFRLVCKNSIEERVLEIREKKPAYDSKYSRRGVMDKDFMERLLRSGGYGLFGGHISR